MYITFWLSIIFGAVVLWFLLSFLYRPIGKIVKKIITGSFDAIEKEDHDKNKY